MNVWGYNGSCPGPMIEAYQGDRVRILVKNELPEGTSMHWHGFELPVGMDGVPGLIQDLIMPGKTYVYEFNLPPDGHLFLSCACRHAGSTRNGGLLYRASQDRL